MDGRLRGIATKEDLRSLRSIRHSGLIRYLRGTDFERRVWEKAPFAAEGMNWQNADEADLHLRSRNVGFQETIQQTVLFEQF